MKNRKSIYFESPWLPPKIMGWLNPNSKLDRPTIIDATPPKDNFIKEIDTKSIEPCGTIKVGCHLDTFNNVTSKFEN